MLMTGWVQALQKTIMLNRIKFKLYWRLRELLERLNILFGNEYIIVYTMGKVGSTSIYYSLKKKFGSKVIFVHRMNKANIVAFNEPFVRNNMKPHRYALALFAKRKIIDKFKPVSIITAIREPVSRNISDFFQDFKAYNAGMDFNEISVDDSIQNFINYYPHHLPNSWFQNEFSNILNIKLDDIHFDTEKKYARFDKDNLRLLILRIDLENVIKDKILEDFLGKQEIKMGVKNAQHQKAYHSYYSEFLEKIKLPQNLVDEIFSHEYVQIFYTKKEIDKFRTRWIDNME